MRRRAALRYLDGRGALSHRTALAVRRLGWDEPRGARIHVTVPSEVRLRSTKGLAVHRHRGFRETYRRGGMTVVSAEEAIVHSWPLLPGCHSPLELWGAVEVFTGPGMPAFARQYAVGGYHLDLYAEEERIAFELGGAAYHSGAGQRERDVRRDAYLASLG